MALQPVTTTFLRYLHDHPEVRDQIRAAPGRTLLYAGSEPNGIPEFKGQKFSIPVWRKIIAKKKEDAQVREKEILFEVLDRIPAPDTAHKSLAEYVNEVAEQLPANPPDDAFIIWRALSGIFAKTRLGTCPSGLVSAQVIGTKCSLQPRSGSLQRTRT